MLLARLRVERVFAEGRRRPLATDAWIKAEDMSGPITYSKGALVLHLLRHEIGDPAVWAGLRTFTRSALLLERAAEDTARVVRQIAERQMGR